MSWRLKLSKIEMAKKLTFNQKVDLLQDILARLERGDLELEEVDKLVAKGLALLAETRTQLANLESKIRKILKTQSED